MLSYFRRSVKDSYFFKGFLILLAMSFGVWGVGDMMGPSSLAPGVVLQAGDSEIKTSLVQRRFGNEMDRFREAMGGQIVTDDIMKRTVMATMMREMTRMATTDAAALDLGIKPSREQLRESITQNPAFHTDGRFDAIRFQEAMMQSQLSEAGYVDLIAMDLRRSLLLQPVAVNAGAPKTLVDGLFAFRNEGRAADTLLIPTSAMALKAPPTDDALKATYERNIAAFTAPEYRKLTVLILGAGDLVKPETIADEDVKTFFDENPGRYRTPESRHVAQLVFDTKEEADAARAHFAAGDTLEALAKKANTGAPIDLGELSAASPLGKAIPAAFEVQAGEITQPVQTPLGWHLIEVKSIKAESAQSFDEVKEEIRKTIAADKAADAVYDASIQMEDALASGTPATEVAKTVGARIMTIDSIDAHGHDKSGAELPNSIDPQNFLAVAFTTPAGKDSKLMDLPTRDGYYVVHVDEVIPPAPKPLAEVRAEVSALWEAEERTAQAQAIADKLAAGITASTQLSSLETKDTKITYASLGPVTRFGEALSSQHLIDSNLVSPQLLDKVFTAKVGDVVVAPVATGIVVARLKDIVIPQPTGELAMAEKELADQIRSEMGSNLLDQLYRAFEAKYPVQVDQAQLDTILATR